MSDIPKNVDPTPQTGFYHRYAIRKLEDILESTPDNSVGIIVADIFQLKTPHDKYGHPPVDEVIDKVGQVFEHHAHTQDIACRFGGDEFLLIIPQTSIQELQERAEQIRQDANKIRVHIDGQPREKIRLSVGTALWPLDTNSYPHPALRAAEALVYFAEQDLQRIRNLYVQEDLL